ncbi:MAG: fatty-acyl-CoA synthase [Pseudonocardia sp.]
MLPLSPHERREAGHVLVADVESALSPISPFPVGRSALGRDRKLLTMSRFLALLLDSAVRSSRGMTTGEPRTAVRRTWPDVHAAARRMAASLRSGDGEVPGLQHGAAVGILAGEPASIAPAAQAVWITGGSVTMLHQPTARTDLAAWAEDTMSVLRMIDAKLVLLGAPFDALAPVLTERGVAFRTIDSLTTTGEDIDPDAEVAGEDDTALLQLTSGSTAEPKAVRITHRNLHANIAGMVRASALDVERDVMVSWLPLFHDMGMVGFLTVPMATGLELVSVTPVDFLTRPVLWAELISKYGGTVTAAPNFAYAVLGRQLARADDGSLDLSSLRIALNGAEPIDPDAVEAFSAAGSRFGLRPDSVVAAYGMAETALGVSFAPIDTGLQVDHIDAEQLEAQRRAVPAGDGPRRRFPKLGPPLPGIEVRVVGDDGSVLGEREVGVLQLRGDSVTPGYLTVDGPVPTQDPEGWLDTGDEGYVVDGAVVVCGRRKDVIIMGGRNIYPTDIERAAADADGVRAGNVVAVRMLTGTEGARHRESFLVAVESRSAGDPEAEKLIRKDVASRVVSAVAVRPAEVVVLGPGSLPKTPSGKLRRAATGELLRARV